jgi:hypothetical protein
VKEVSPGLSEPVEDRPARRSVPFCGRPVLDKLGVRQEVRRERRVDGETLKFAEATQRDESRAAKARAGR